MKAWLRDPRSRWLLAAVALAACVRLVGIGHDLPLVYYPDEQHLVNRAVSLGGGDLNPHWFHKPAGLMYLLLFEYGIAFGVGRVLGAFHSTDDFALRYFTDPSLFFWIARFTVCAFGVATVVAVWRIGKSRFSRDVGLLAALLLALTVAHVYSSQEVKEDVPCTFFTTIALLFLVRVAEAGRVRDLLAAGAFGGLAMATKYYALFLFPVAGVAAFLGRFGAATRDDRGLGGDVRAFLALVGFAVVFQAVFFLGSPFNFVDPTWYAIDFRPPIERVMSERLSLSWLLSPFDLYFRASVTFQSVTTTIALLLVGAFGFVGFGRMFRTRARVAFLLGIPLAFVAVVALLAVRSPRFQLSVSWWRWVLFGDTGLGVVYASVALVAIVAAAVRRRAVDLVVVAAIASYFVLAGLYEQPQGIAPRHLNVIYPIFALATAALAVDVVKFVGRTTAVAVARVTACGLVIALVAEPSVVLAEHTVRNLRDDTRTLAKNWFESNVPAGARVINDKEYVKICASARCYEALLQKLEKLANQGRGGSFTKDKDKYYAYQIRASNSYAGPTYEVLILDPPWWLYAEADLDKANVAGMGNPLAVRIPRTLDAYRHNGFRWVLTTSKSYDEYTRDDMRKNWPSWARFYDALLATSPAMIIAADPWRNGPEVRIYEIR
ncbi:MAG: glycosyltransferase family 39 protein [Planctomycetes bacterium]|nr:glycosyltransferase family 39 protein [Planctomycetota bacterium]MBI3848563.1 glycosyltransferase family 39 protein [Planctomycetota bacterium]